MGRIIIKASQDADRYGEYSSVVDNFTYVNATRAQMLDYLVKDFCPGTERYDFERAQAAKRLGRVDATGTSSYIGDGTWDDRVMLIRENQPDNDGLLARTDVGEFMRRLEHGESTNDLLTPFDWDE